MKNRLLFIVTIVSIVASFAQQTIVVEQPNGSNTRVFQDIDSAFLALTPNDRVYLPEGSFTLHGDARIINQSGVSIYGTGHKIDSTNTNRTDISGYIYIMANNITLEGIRFNDYLKVGINDTNFVANNINDLTINRCFIYGYPPGGSNNSNPSILCANIPVNINILESIIAGDIKSYTTSRAKVFCSRSVLFGQIDGLEKSVFINNIFLFKGYHGYGYSQYNPVEKTNESLFTNNIFKSRNYFIYVSSQVSSSISYNNIFKNNHFGDTITSNFSNPIFSLGTNSFFNNTEFDLEFLGGNLFTGSIHINNIDTFDFHIPLIYGLSDKGIFTDDYEGNKNSRPSNPQIVIDTIGSSTNDFGVLNVKIRAVTKGVDINQ